MKKLLSGVMLSYLVVLYPGAPRAQALVGDGLRGDYYEGLNFERLVRTQQDGLLNFSWRGMQPVSGVAPENFSVRWTGWLVPPVSGRYVLHIDADDGVRLWLNGRQLLDEWRGQPLSYFAVPVQLEAGRPYALRLDYCQYSRDTRLHLAWELPQTQEVLHSWRTLWGLADAPLVGGSHREETIQTQYLFSRFPAAPPKDQRLLVMTATQPTRQAAAVRPQPKPMKVQLGEVKVRSVKPRSVRATATQRADTLAARLAKGQALTLRTLYFEQGKADLPTPVQASLDTLAQALRRYPTLRLEVQGHTDNQGDPLLNQQLSQRRAEAVCRYLAERGIDPIRLQPLGLGGTQPVADNNLLAERPRNRRVVLRPLP